VDSAAPGPTSIGVDVGGTFTDFVIADALGLRVHKVPSTPPDPSEAILGGLADLGIVTWAWFVHGSTVATNAILERKGARAAFLATEGFRDLLEIGRQTRLDLYSLAPRKHRPLIPRQLCFEVPERVDRHGAELAPLERHALEATLDAVVAAGAESIAICFLFSFANPAHERLAGEQAAARGLHVSLSSEILPEYREYERASTVAANAYVAPVVGRYLQRLASALTGAPSRVPSREHPNTSERQNPARPLPRIMQSNGGVISLETARREAVRTVLSGPAGGVVGAWRIAQRAGVERLIAFDMGGTSTDVSLVEGRPLPAREASIDHLPVRVPMLDIHTVGAGGGSIARVDRGGALRVGPESAGADPGPAAYGRGEPGAQQPTVTDANLVLGRFYPPAFLGGRMALDPKRARAAVASIAVSMGIEVEAAAEGVIRVVNAQMARALRRVSLERGHDPRAFCLVAFGGSGPLHACELAQEVGVRQVLVPRFPGALSALGMLLSDVEKDYSRTVMFSTGATSSAALGTFFRRLEARARRALAEEGVASEAMAMERWLEMRYVGQSYELSVPARPLSPASIARRFHERHCQAFGYASDGQPTEIVSVRLRATGRLPKPDLGAGRVEEPSPSPHPLARQPVYFGGWRESPVFDRAALAPGLLLQGTALLAQEDSTTLVPPGWVCRVDPWYNVLLTAD
jgi:N-methylhydantoinase A